MSEPVLAYLRGILASLAESKGCFVIEINGEADHIHLLVQNASANFSFKSRRIFENLLFEDDS